MMVDLGHPQAKVSYGLGMREVTAESLRTLVCCPCQYSKPVITKTQWTILVQSKFSLIQLNFAKVSKNFLDFPGKTTRNLNDEN